MNTKTWFFITVILLLMFFNYGCKNRTSAQEESQKIDFELLDSANFRGIMFYNYLLIPVVEKYNDSLVILEEIMKHEAMLKEAIARKGQHTFFNYYSNTKVRIEGHPVLVHPYLLMVWLHQNGKKRVFWRDNLPVIDTLFPPFGGDSIAVVLSR